MSIKQFNIATQEQVDYTLTRQAPVISGADLYRATGETEEKHWTGPWAELKTRFDALEASVYRRLSATLHRVADGEFAELSATWSFYTNGDGSTSESGAAVQPGEDRDHPEYDLQVQTVQEPILTHPKWASLSEDTLTAMKMVMDGYKRTEKITLSDGKTQSTIYDVLKSVSPKDLLQLLLKGVTAYNSPHCVLTVRYKSTEVPAISTVGTIVQNVPGGFATPSGRNWYFHGPSWQMKGSELWITEVYELSGPGGWNSFIYGSSAL